MQGDAPLGADINQDHAPKHCREHPDSGIGHADAGGLTPAFSGKGTAHNASGTVAAVEGGHRQQAHRVWHIVHHHGEPVGQRQPHNNLGHKDRASDASG